MSLAIRLWEDHWHLICHRNELPLPGDYLRMQVLDDEIVVFNDNGDLVAFDNRCPHRGAWIFEGSTGNRPASCAYHGWTFSGGRMIIPNPSQFASCDLASADIHRWRTEWLGDFLFVGKSPTQELSDQLGDLRPLLEDITFGVAGRSDWSSYDYECDWRIAMENALEPYHVPLIHPNTLGKLDLQAGENHYVGRNSIWYAPVGDERMARQLKGLKRLFQLDFQYEGYMSIYIFPFTMLSSTFGYSYSLQSFFPSVKQDRTHFASRLLRMATRANVDDSVLSAFFSSTAEINRRVFDEDHQICKRMPTSSWSAQPPKYISDSEAKVAHFRQSCREFMLPGGA